MMVLAVYLPVHGQDSTPSIDDLAEEIVFYSDINYNASLISTQERIKEKLDAACVSFLEHPSSYNYEFRENVWVSIKQPEDGSFKIYTYRVKDDKYENSYVGFLQLKDGTFFRLSDMSAEMEDVEYDALDPDYWYGALYYHISTIQDNQNQPVYLLYGYDEVDEFTNRKVLETLTFTDGKASFGKSIIKYNIQEGQRDDIKSRLILEYSSDAQVSLNYDHSLGMIVYDNLIQRMGQLPGQGPTQYPDGSYRGLKWDEGMLVYVDKLYHQVSDQAPRPQPVLGNKAKKDIFGKSKN